MREAWTKQTLSILPEQDLTNYNLESTYKFQISNPSTSTAKMARMVNLIPYKDKDTFKFRKRPGCKSATLLSSTLVGVTEAIMSSTSVFYISAINTPNQAYLMASTNGTTWNPYAPGLYTNGAFTCYGGLRGGTGDDNLSETSISDVIYIMGQSNISLSSPPANSDSTFGYYIRESDVTGGTYGLVTGTCSITLDSAVVTNIASTASMLAGQSFNITGGTAGGVTTNTWIVSVDSGTQVTLGTTLPFTTGTGYFSKGAVFYILDADFPGNNSIATIGRFISLNGYIYIMTVNGRIYNSDINSISSWPGDYLSVQISPDYGRTLALYRNHILAFGERSIEFFRDAGNDTGSPLASVPELFIGLGIRNARHLAQMEDTLCFMANTKEGSNAIYIFDGFRPVKISTSDIDYIISKIGPTNFELKTMRLNGKMCLLVNRTNTSTSTEFITLVYYIEETVWGEWKVTEGGTAADYTHPWQFPMGSLSGTFYSVSDYQATNGVYVSTFLAESDNNYYDNLAASTKNVTAYIQTKPLIMGSLNRKFLSELRLLSTTTTLFNPGTAVTVYWSDDFGQTWTSRTFTSTKQFMNSLGSFKQRIFRIVEATNDFWQFEAMELFYKLGTH